MRYFMIGGDKREYGPVEAELIRQWIREGRANAQTLVREETATDWQPLGQVAEFADAFAATAAPIPTDAGAPIAPNDSRVSIGHAFGRAVRLMGEHFGTIAGATLLVWLPLSLMEFFCSAGPLITPFFAGPLYGGLFLFFLQLIRTGEASPLHVYTLGRDKTPQLVVTWLLTRILATVGMMCCCFLPGIYLYIAWLLALPIVADQSIGFWQAMETSRKTVTRQWFRFLGLFIFSFLPVLVFHFYMMFRMMSELAPHYMELATSGMTPADTQKFMETLKTMGASYASWALMKQLLLLITIPLGVGSLAFVYEDLFGRKK